MTAFFGSILQGDAANPPSIPDRNRFFGQFTHGICMNANAFQIENAFDVYSIVACFVLFPIIYILMVLKDEGWLRFYYCIPLAFAVAMALPIFVIGSALIAATKAFWKELMNKFRWIRNEML